MSQSTCTGIKTFIPSNRGPRYFRPMYTDLDSSTTSTSLFQNATQLITNVNIPIIGIQTDCTCSICNKILPTTKGMKIAYIRIIARRKKNFVLKM